MFVCIRMRIRIRFCIRIRICCAGTRCSLVSNSMCACWIHKFIFMIMWNLLIFIVVFVCPCPSPKSPDSASVPEAVPQPRRKCGCCSWRFAYCFYMYSTAATAICNTRSFICICISNSICICIYLSICNIVCICGCQLPATHTKSTPQVTQGHAPSLPPAARRGQGHGHGHRHDVNWVLGTGWAARAADSRKYKLSSMPLAAFRFVRSVNYRIDPQMVIDAEQLAAKLRHLLPLLCLCLRASTPSPCTHPATPPRTIFKLIRFPVIAVQPKLCGQCLCAFPCRNCDLSNINWNAYAQCMRFSRLTKHCK